jgi:hypothetical protein
MKDGNIHGRVPFAQIPIYLTLDEGDHRGEAVRSKIVSELASLEYTKADYYLSHGFAYSKDNISISGRIMSLIIYNKDMLQDTRVRELLLEYLI